MCGIAGMYLFDQTPLPVEPLRKMASALAHRGPDEERLYFGNAVGLAHRRLKIIDLSEAASQPMTDETGRFHLIFNGEIYNFCELRKDLEKKYTFFSRSDTEVILRLFQEHHEKSWELLNGMFGIGLYDSKERELFLVRDHAGIKPLYYYHDHEKVLFASELKSLFSSGLISPEMDTASLSLYLQLGYFPGSCTAYRGIKKLKQGEIARVHPGGIELTSYWSIRSHLPGSMKVDSDPARRLEELLTKSVEQQMISDVPLGAFLSGGIDSSLLVALMSHIASDPVKTFTVGFSRMGYYDERAEAARVSKLFGTEHHEFVVDSRVDEIIPQLVSVFDEPFADSSSMPTFCLAQLARKHVTVALSGTGGDEIFGGYRKYMAANWASAYTSLPGSVRATIRKAASLLPASRQSLWKERALLLQRFSSLRPDAAVNLQLNSIFTLAEVSELLSESAVRPLNLDFVPVPGTIAENMMLFDYEHYLTEDLLVKEDRCTMAFGLEARVPYLDRHLVELMTSLPLRFKVSPTATKRLFRKVADTYLPKWVLNRPKHGFGSPVAEWLRSDLQSMARDFLFSSRAFLKSPLIHRKFDEHQKRVADHSRQLWALLMLELWYKRS